MDIRDVERDKRTKKTREKQMLQGKEEAMSFNDVLLKLVEVLDNHKEAIQELRDELNLLKAQNEFAKGLNDHLARETARELLDGFKPKTDAQEPKDSWHRTDLGWQKKPKSSKRTRRMGLIKRPKHPSSRRKPKSKAKR